MRTPVRAVWPLPPRPACLPLPEPMPRPTRIRFLREPALSAISLSFIALSPCYFLLLLADDADEMLNLGDHAANLGGILQLGDAADLVELQPDQRRALRVVAADCAMGLLDLDRLCGLGHRPYLRNARQARCCYSATASASPPTRRDCNVDTLMLRRAATERGESWCLSALKVARTML